MRKRLLSTFLLTALILMIFSIPVLADVFRYTSTGFRYRGDISQFREVLFEGGGAYTFVIEGDGTVQGTSQVINTVKYVYEGKEELVRIRTRLTGVTAEDAALDRKLAMVTAIELPIKSTEIITGVEMEPGESGYISQDAVSRTSPDGESLRVTNRFGNTGGRTGRTMSIDGFVEDTLSVDGYAEVLEYTRIRSGEARGFSWWPTY